MAGPKLPPAPRGLAPPGRKLWRAIIADVPDGFHLDARERYLLERACRCADELAELDAAIDRDGPISQGSRGQPRIHPALQEARALRLVQLRLLAAIKLDPPVEEHTPGVRQARRAAEARWARRRANVVVREASA